MDNHNLRLTPELMRAERDHRRQTFWQILLPVLVIGLGMLALFILAIVTTAAPGSDYDTHWANISLIWLSIPTIISCLIFMVILFGMVFGMSKALGGLPNLTAKILYYSRMVGRVVRTAGDKLVSPIMKVNSSAAGLRALVRHFQRK